jgi:hypothetical protein
MIKIKDIILWEQLRGKSFEDFDAKDYKDDLSILYVIDEADKQERVTLGLYEKALSETDTKQVRARIKKINDDILFSSQFFIVANEKSENDGKSEKQNVGDIIGSLICLGISPESILNMDLCYLSYLTDQYAKYVKNRLTDKRFWAMLQLSPYLDKGTEAHDFMPFPWEKSQNGEDDKITDKDINIAKCLFGLNKK